ncbi:MAG TPA: acylneuraminate cytidylyltransferase family protein [Candidatus Omnitrophota bacterium]|nr:acylneuraminate cytidylyltransferase family protein [Candidatus Omnitrophota bacterium]
MIRNKSFVALIPARAGSKGIKHKNRQLLNGKPLIAYTIEAALASDTLDGCFVSTNDEQIKKIARRLGAYVIERPNHLCSDSAGCEKVAAHALTLLAKEGMLPDYLVLLQPTSPLRNKKHIDECLKKFATTGAKSAISVTPCEHHPYKDLIIKNKHLNPLFDKKWLHQARQKLPKIYRQNGALYAVSARDFLKQMSFFIPPVMPFIMENQASIDIDSALELKCAALVLRENIFQQERR